MVVAFCGHSDYVENGNDEEIVIELLERIAVGTEIEFFLGGYGSFDDFAYKCAKRFTPRQGLDNDTKPAIWVQGIAVFAFLWYNIFRRAVIVWAKYLVPGAE